MSDDKRTVDDLLAEAEIEYVELPKKNGVPSHLDRQTLALSENLMTGRASQRTLANQPQNLGLLSKEKS